MQCKAFVVAFASVAGLDVAVDAHHSHANYEISTWTVMQGTVKQIVFIAPHSIVYLDVTDEKGDVATWALEATNPRGILGNGVKREDVRPATRSRRGATCSGTARRGVSSASSRRCTATRQEAMPSNGSGTSDAPP